MNFGDKDFVEALDFLGLDLLDFESLRFAGTFNDSVTALTSIKSRVKKTFRKVVTDLHPDRNIDLPKEEMEEKQRLLRLVVEAVEIINKLTLVKPKYDESVKLGIILMELLEGRKGKLKVKVK